ncbi:MAG: glutathione S-transferase family protein [Pseudomonadota bacterium]
MKVYGVSVSYYTGKLEAYLRYKGLSYDMESPFAIARELKPKVGAIQVPLVLRDDGRYMSDSTPIIAQLDAEHPESSVYPCDPVVRFIALLIEDYADEWLWRPAMHYRWSYEHDRALLSRILADEVAGHVPAPRWLLLRRISRRQHKGFVLNDGVTAATREHVESSYRAALRVLGAMLRNRPFALGDAPSIADFGLMGPMLRHFGQDPTPAEIMRNEAPAVYAWVARVWNARAATTPGALLDAVPHDAGAMLEEIGETHLVALRANAEAYARGEQKFALTVQGVRYVDLPVSRYRVYCLERLREAFAGLSESERDQVRALLATPAASVIWEAEPPAASGHDPERSAPFAKGINVFGDGVPR